MSNIIAKAIARYLENGGEIEQCPTGYAVSTGITLITAFPRGGSMVSTPGGCRSTLSNPLVIQNSTIEIGGNE